MKLHWASTHLIIGSGRGQIPEIEVVGKSVDPGGLAHPSLAQDKNIQLWGPTGVRSTDTEVLGSWRSRISTWQVFCQGMWWILDCWAYWIASKKKKDTKKEYCLRLIRAIWKKLEVVFVVFFPKERIKIMEDNYGRIRRTHTVTHIHSVIHTCLKGSQRRGSSLTLERQVWD